MTLFLTLTLAEADTGPFNLFSDVDGYTSAMAVNVPKATLLAGYSLPSAPDGTTIVRVKSVGVCTTVLDITVGVITTTTTTTLPLVLPVVGDCCGGAITHYITYNPLFTVGLVVTSVTEGFFGGYTVTGGPIPGVADLVVVDTTTYVDCATFLAFYAGVACNPV